MKFDSMWKVFTVILGVVIMPLSGWVWQVNVEVAQLRNDLGDLEESYDDISERLEESDENSRSIIGIQKDIEYIKGSIGRIEDIVTE
tara:strand:+ start:279 stop:539 length:261 start_codon:yes stop_codon:yes gene_type:complete